MIERTRENAVASYRRLRKLAEGCARAQHAANTADSPEQARAIREQLDRTLAASARQGTKIKLPPPASKSSRSTPPNDRAARLASKRRRVEAAATSAELVTVR